MMFSKISRSVPAAQSIPLSDPKAGLEGIIVIHSNVLGPGAGGCRLWPYPSLDDAFADAYGLAQGMSYKNALAGLPFGGAKAVLRLPPGNFDRSALFRAFGNAVEHLDGRYVTAEDVGTTIADMREVAAVTSHVAGLDIVGTRAGGDPSPWTARGVFDALEAAARWTFGSDLKGLTVAIQGTGNVGSHLCRKLADAGARLIIADIAPERRDRLRSVLDARVVHVDDISKADADIFVPCALGGALTESIVGQMKAKLVCGGANNQLATPDVANCLVDRGITYVPDYVANAGGIISVSAEYLAEDHAVVAARVAEIGPRVTMILEESARLKLSPATVADRMAEQLLAGKMQRDSTISN